VDENHAPELVYGMAASPLIIAEKIIVTPGGPRGHCIVAYDKATGTPIWHTLDDEASYSSPMEANLGGNSQVLVACETRVVGLNPDNGKLLWEFPWVVAHGNRNIAQPLLLSGNRVFLSGGYGTGCLMMQIRKTADGFTAHEMWRNKNLKNKFSSSVLQSEYIYGLDEDILTCLDARTGSRMWKDGRYGYGQIVLASGQLIILSGSGELAFVRAEPDKYLEVCRIPGISGKTWNHPAIGQGKLLIRNSREMACIDLSGQNER